MPLFGIKDVLKAPYTFLLYAGYENTVKKRAVHDSYVPSVYFCPGMNQENQFGCVKRHKNIILLIYTHCPSFPPISQR